MKVIFLQAVPGSIHATRAGVVSCFDQLWLFWRRWPIGPANAATVLTAAGIGNTAGTRAVGIAGDPEPWCQLCQHLFFVSWCLNCSSALASCLLLWLVTLCVWGFLLEGSGSWMAVGVVLFNVPVSCRDTHRDMWVAYAPIHICVITWELTHADLQYKTESWKEVWEGEPVDKSPPKWIRHLYEQSVRRRRGYPTGELHP